MNRSWANVGSTMFFRIVLATLIVVGMITGLILSAFTEFYPVLRLTSYSIDNGLHAVWIWAFELVVGGVCLLWAPWGGMICARLARSKGLSVHHSATVGAIYSILFFFPWLYLVMRIHNRTVWKPAIWFVYFSLYAGWLFGTITTMLLPLSVHQVGSGSLYNSYLLLSLGMFSAMCIAWCGSLFHLVIAVLGSKDGTAIVETSNPEDGLIGGVYIAPFALSFASMALLPIGLLGG